jgi:hypothetical protein
MIIIIGKEGDNKDKEKRSTTTEREKSTTMTRSKERKRVEDQKKKDENSWRHGATSSDANTSPCHQKIHISAATHPIG